MHRKEIVYLFATFEEEDKGINAVIYRTSNEGNPMKDDGGFLRVSEEKLTKDIQHNCKNNKGGNARKD